MDEMISYDGVKQILTSSTWHDFWWAVSDGGDHRYGRIFYNLSAILSALPYRLFGDPGLIFAIRSTQVFLLLTAYVVLCRVMLTTWVARALCLTLLCCLPFTAYYLTMPKPEPLQLLLLACFLAQAVSKRFAPGGHWIFLGLAFGAKISAAPFCAAAGIAALIAGWLDQTPGKKLLRQTTLAAFTFLAGWVLAIPFLLFPSATHLQQYLDWTFRSTGHSLDDASVSAAVWLQSLASPTYANNYYLSKPVASFFLVTLGGFVLVQFFALAGARRNLREAWFRHRDWIVLGFSAALLIPIIFLVKRVWGLYLHTGEVFGTVALVALGEKALRQNSSRAILDFFSRLTSVLMAATALWVAWQALPMVWHSYQANATRTSQPAFVRQTEIYHAILGRIESFAAVSGRGEPDRKPVRIFYDPALFLPDSKPGMTISAFWNYDLNWSLEAEAFVIGYENNLEYFIGDRALPSTTSANYSPLVKACELFRESVEMRPGGSTLRPYHIAGWLGRDAVVIVRTDLLQTWKIATGSFQPLAEARPPGDRQ